MLTFKIFVYLYFHSRDQLIVSYFIFPLQAFILQIMLKKTFHPKYIILRGISSLELILFLQLPSIISFDSVPFLLLCIFLFRDFYLFLGVLLILFFINLSYRPLPLLFLPSLIVFSVLSIFLLRVFQLQRIMIHNFAAIATAKKLFYCCIYVNVICNSFTDVATEIFLM